MNQLLVQLVNTKRILSAAEFFPKSTNGAAEWLSVDPLIDYESFDRLCPKNVCSVDLAIVNVTNCTFSIRDLLALQEQVHAFLVINFDFEVQFLHFETKSALLSEFKAQIIEAVAVNFEV